MIIFRNFTYERSFADELFRGFEFRITITIWNYLRGSNFELLANTIFISRMSGLRINFRKNYDRIFSLFQGVGNPGGEEGGLGGYHYLFSSRTLIFEENLKQI